MVRATLMGSRSTARKYEYCTIASPAIPSQAIRGTSPRAIRSRRGAASASAPASRTNATVTRTWLRLAADTPSSNRNRTTEPLTAKNVAATAASR
jgi:hypothetical protein